MDYQLKVEFVGGGEEVLVLKTLHKLANQPVAALVYDIDGVTNNIPLTAVKRFSFDVSEYNLVKSGIDLVAKAGAEAK